MVEAKRAEYALDPLKEHIALSKPVLVLVTGAGGTGKSSLIHGLFVDGVKVAPGLADLLPNVYIVDKDVIGDEFTPSRGPDYQKTAKDPTYKRVLEETRKGISKGLNIFVDASHRSQVGEQGWEAPYRELTEQYGAEFIIIRLVAPVAVIRDRYIRRKSIKDKHKKYGTVEELDNWFAENEPIHMPMPKGTLIIDSSQDFNEIVRQALEFIIISQKPTEVIDINTTISG
ncbi:MAG: ATP-binding protein [Patescibacteria group bacterium]|nr:ATP-binding protein [Patescibacteria group bacterium]